MVRPMTARGFRDVLFSEALERESVAAAVSDAFASWGYDPVESPVVEEDSTLQVGAGAELERSSFRLFDLDGSLLALRPEMTVPIARIAASRLAAESGPYRIRYAGPVFREHASLRGQARQFTQLGVELIGASGPAADAEIVLLLLGALEASGLESYLVGLGTGEVLRALLARSGGPEAWQSEVIAAAQDGNLVEIDRLAGRPGIDAPVARALREVPRIGGTDALERCREVIAPCGCEESLDGLLATWRLLEQLGETAHVRIDFGIMRSFGYYTGIQLEAYAPGLGLPLAGGGRYDRLLGLFGAPMPAAGFAIGLERLMIALAEEDRTPAVKPLDAVLGGADAAAVLAASRRLREVGWRVRVAPGRAGLELVRAADAAGATEALEAHDGSIVRLDRAGERALPLGEPLPAPLRRTAQREGGDAR